MTLKDVLVMHIQAMIAVYVVFATGVSFVNWDISMVNPGNWENLTRFIFMFISLLISFKIWDEYWTQEDDQ